MARPGPCGGAIIVRRAHTTEVGYKEDVLSPRRQLTAPPRTVVALARRFRPFQAIFDRFWCTRASRRQINRSALLSDRTQTVPDGLCGRHAITERVGRSRAPNRSKIANKMAFFVWRFSARSRVVRPPRALPGALEHPTRREHSVAEPPGGGTLRGRRKRDPPRGSRKSRKNRKLKIEVSPSVGRRFGWKTGAPSACVRVGAASRPHGPQVSPDAVFDFYRPTRVPPGPRHSIRNQVVRVVVKSGSK